MHQIRAILIALLLAPLAAVDAADGQRPNIVIVVADDLGYGDLGCYGGRFIPTPNLDRLAMEGMRFTQAYAGCTVCAPSRCALMTGLHTGHAQVRANTSVKPEGQQPLAAGTFTLARLLKNAGYVTGGFGKWALGGPGSSGEPARMGFDDFFGYLDQNLAHDYYPTMLRRHAEEVPLDGKTYSHTVILDAALDFIGAAAGRPFFLYLPITLPHGRLVVPDASAFAGQPWPQPVKNYAAMVALLDRDMGRLLDRLDENTVVFFTSDNGPEVAYFRKLHPEHVDTLDSNGPLRGFKRDLYEGGIRVPLIVRWPGRIKPGVSRHVCALWDVLPTLADITGQKVSVECDGLSFAPTLLGQPGQKNHDHLYWEFHEGGFAQAVRFGDWKAVRRGPAEPVELYHVANDVGETQDLAPQQQDLVSRAEELFRTARSDSSAVEINPATTPGSGFSSASRR